MASGQAPHTVSTGASRESDPRQWWDALCEALDQCGEAAREAAAVSIGGQQHGLVTLDAHGDPVRPALLWNDVQSAPQARRLVEELGGLKAWADRTGSVPGASFTVTKWAWLAENEPEAVRATAAVRLPHDYLTERLTGQGTTDRGDASGTGWWASATESYDEEILAHVGLDPALLPRVVRPGEVAGTVRDAHDLPFSKGTLVAPGTGDNAAAALGLGLRPGTPVLSLGTSGTVYAVSKRRPTDPTGTVAGFADAHGDWLPLACTLNCTLAVDRIAALLGRDREAVEPGTAVTLLPFLDGERTPNSRTPRDCCTACGTTPRPASCCRRRTTGRSTRCWAPSIWCSTRTPTARFRCCSSVAVPAQGVAGDGAPPLGASRAGAGGQGTRRAGAAAQAAGLLTGEDPAAVARRWDTARGPVLEAVQRDEAALTRIAGVLSDAAPLLEREPDRH